MGSVHSTEGEFSTTAAAQTVKICHVTSSGPRTPCGRLAVSDAPRGLPGPTLSARCPECLSVVIQSCLHSARLGGELKYKRESCAGHDDTASHRLTINLNKYLKTKQPLP